MESQPTIMESWLMITYPQVGRHLESPNSEQESADSTADSTADPPRIGMWVWAFSLVIAWSYVELCLYVLTIYYWR